MPTRSVSRAVIGGAEVALVDADRALARILERLDARAAVPPLAVVSVNLDHVHHLHADPAFRAALADEDVEWLPLIDGAPIAARARALTGRRWPRLAGSDLIGPILEGIAGRRFGVIGGTEETHRMLFERLAGQHPEVFLAGAWAPKREQLADPDECRRLAGEIADARVEVLLVALGKPRQEQWISAYGPESGARVLLAFGAVVDFLAGRVRRAPGLVATLGMEWAWRLALEPRRLARRYLVQGPPSYLAVRRESRLRPPLAAPSVEPPAATTGRFVTGDDPAEVAVIVVTYNSSDDIGAFLNTLRAETVSTAIRMVVADNSSTDHTVEVARRNADVTVIATGGNLGYSAGINAASRTVPVGEHLLVLNPDLEVLPGAVRAVLDRLAAVPAAGIVAPMIVDRAGELSHSLRREPSLTRAVGDAVLGGRWRRRPTWLSDIDWRDEDYGHAHPVDWASGAALLVRAELAAALRWEEGFFLYSEETEYQRRARADGWEVWFEPAGRVLHRQGGSGASPALVALNEVNRVRYVRRHHGRGYTAAYRGAVALHNVIRSRRPGARAALSAVLRGSSWGELPRAVPDDRPLEGLDIVRGSIVIPAHDEAGVIGRTLRGLGGLPTAPALEVIVVANGCTDATARRAAEVDGVRVVEIAEASKTAALNAGDAAARYFPRLYLDADIRIRPATVLALFAALKDGTAEAARPESVYDTTGAAPAVRAYYRARSRMPSLASALWGAGAYAVSERGRSRFGAFPSLVADDLFIDRLFPRDSVVVPTAVPPVLIAVPRTTRALRRTLARVVRGNDEQGGANTTGTTARELLRSVRSPRTAADAVVYAGFMAAARFSARYGRSGSRVRWERDNSTRGSETAS